MRTEESEVCTSTEEKSYLCWSFGDIGSCRINKGWSPRDDQRLDGGTEGRSPEQSLLLEGSTVTGQVATSTDSDEDSTRLWHMRLGHTGESRCKLLQDKDY